MIIDDLLLQKCKNNRQRKLANIRTKNHMVNHYQELKNKEEIVDFKIRVKIKNNIQSAAVYILPVCSSKEITVNIGFKSVAND